MATGIQISPSSDITVGTTAISNGTEGRVLFQGAGNVVQQDSGFSFNSTSKRLDIGNTVTPSSVAINLLSNNYIRLGNSHGYIRAAATSSIVFYDASFNIQAGVSWGGTGSFFNTSLAVGTNTAGARLDVRAQGALSTDIAFRVRNSADNLDIIRATGAGDVFIGIGAGNSSTGANVTALGVNSLRSNTSGSHNTSFGHTALFSITTSAANTAMGSLALINLTSGDNNIAFGFNSGRYISSGANLTISNSSLFIGNGTRPDADNQTNQIVIGNAAIGAGSNTATLGNTSIVKTILRGTINAAGLPTSPVGLVAGDIWNNGGVLNIV